MKILRRRSLFMKRRKVHILMLAVLLAQSVGSTVTVFATTTDNTGSHSQNIDSADTPAELNSENLLEHDVVGTLPENQNTIINGTDQTTKSKPSTQEKDETPAEITEQSNTDTIPTPELKNAETTAAIEDEILANMTITDMSGTEYNQTAINRLLNSTPVIAKMNFVVEDKNYAPGSVYTMTLPEHLGYSDVSGEVANVGATWSVDAQSKTLTITFNQRITETQFNLDLKSYVYTNAAPLVTIKTPGKKQISITLTYMKMSHRSSMKKRLTCMGLMELFIIIWIDP